MKKQSRKSPKKKVNTVQASPEKNVVNYSFDSIDLSFLKKVIEKLNETDFSTVAFDQVQEVIDLVMEGYSVRLMGLRPPALYRARKNPVDVVFDDVRELWYPPSNFVEIGRLNLPKQSMFYCSDDQNIALLEVRPSPGDKVTMLQCILKEDLHLRLLPIGIQRYLKNKHEDFGAIPFEDELPEKIFSNSEDFAKNNLIHEYFIQELTKVVESDKPFEYHTTAAMSVNFLNPLNQIDGILYPSVAAGQKGKNLVLKPEIADKHLIPIAAWEYQIIKQTEPFVYECICTNSSIGLNNHKIQWE